jgi:hypothetical protein
VFHVPQFIPHAQPVTVYPEGQAAMLPFERISVHCRVGLETEPDACLRPGQPAGPGASGNPFFGYPGMTADIQSKNH